MVYCVVPCDVTGRVRRSIDRGFTQVPGIEVIAERRGAERRAAGGRRVVSEVRPGRAERRRVRYVDGRRIAERRAVLVPVPAPEWLPRGVRQHAERVSFLEALDVPPDFREDVEAVRAIVRFQGGERDIDELYDRWFDPIYTYMSVALERGCEVEGAVSTALAGALRELSHVSPEPAELRPWLFGIAHRVACPSPLRLPQPGAAGWNGHGAVAAQVADPSLEWLSDDDLVLLVERRPAAERHLLVLRYFAGLSFAEIATIMDVGATDAVALHRLAVDSLDATLSGITRSPRTDGRHAMGRLVQQTPVLQRRRRALLSV
jgi:DNA-directed RNA polymerase specialized sigma24 family protein